MAQKMSEVGGVPLFWSATGTTTSAVGTTPDVVSLAVPTGFTPTYVRVKDTTATNPRMFEWFYGMPAASAIVTTGTTGAITYIAADGITVATGSVTLGSGVQADGTVYSVAAFRAGDGTEVGGVPLFYSTYGTSAADDVDVVLTTPKGFYPDWVIVVDDYTGGASNDAATRTEWFRGVASGSALTVAANGDRSISTSGITVASGSITLGVDCQLDSATYVVFAGRFSQINEGFVGGVPITFSSTAAIAADSALAITTDPNFFPDWVMVVDNALETASTTTEWFRGMANPSAVLTSSAGVRTVLTSTGITPAAGSITIGTGCHVNGKTYSLYAARYSA